MSVGTFPAGPRPHKLCRCLLRVFPWKPGRRSLGRLVRSTPVLFAANLSWGDFERVKGWETRWGTASERSSACGHHADTDADVEEKVGRVF